MFGAETRTIMSLGLLKRLFFILTFLVVNGASQKCHQIAIKTISDVNCDFATSPLTAFAVTGFNSTRNENFPGLLESRCAETLGEFCNFTLCDTEGVEVFAVDSDQCVDSWLFQVYINGVLSNPEASCAEQTEVTGNSAAFCDCENGNAVNVLDCNFGCNPGDFFGCSRSSSNSNLRVFFPFPEFLPEDKDADKENNDFPLGIVIGGVIGGLVVASLILFLAKQKRDSGSALSRKTIKGNVSALSSYGSSGPPPTADATQAQKKRILGGLVNRPRFEPQSQGRGTPVQRYYPSSHESGTTTGSDINRYFSAKFESINASDVNVEQWRTSINDDEVSKAKTLKRIVGATSLRFPKAASDENEMIREIQRTLQSKFKPMSKMEQFGKISSTPSVVPNAYKRSRTVTSLVITSLQLDKENAETNDKFADSKQYSEPKVPLQIFLDRLVRYLDLWFYDLPGVKAVGTRSLLFSVLYFERMRKRDPEFKVTKYNVHRLFAVSMLVAAKFTEDEVITNAYWAEVLGISIHEMNEMEETFCNAAQFDFLVTDRQLKALYDAFRP